ncbi:hypothetical protein [Lacinutrix sp. MedPE-SW]|uniref:hypothetical protein n=1 Tax=Lacinutrix sp. MedPE-SW TaxID=1860087 RepID=UPI000921F24C|nr:hypothetical protein [Lacinutrix sp. MedPE-SW]OIQ21193.1 MAG: hypothetical protein BM549_09465 [Lacinutrix sp. MedPE-SW]
MAVSVAELFEEFRLKPKGSFSWNHPLDANYNGVYVLALTSNPNDKEPHPFNFEICDDTFSYWLSQATDLQINGEKVTKKEQVKQYLKQFWNPNENILYIGESSSPTNPLQKRIKQFYSHKVGQKGPHTGGYWLKLLSCLNNVSVYYAQAQNPREVEFKMLMKFVELSTGKSFYEIENFANYLPFANVKLDVSKKHFLTKHTNRNKRVQKSK